MALSRNSPLNTCILNLILIQLIQKTLYFPLPLLDQSIFLKSKNKSRACLSLHSVPTSRQQASPSFFLHSAQAPSASSNHPSPLTPACSRLHCPSPGCAACRAHDPTFCSPFLLHQPRLAPGFPQSIHFLVTKPSPVSSSPSLEAHGMLTGDSAGLGYVKVSEMRSGKQKLKIQKSSCSKMNV